MGKPNLEELVDRLRRRETPALARALSLIENGAPSAGEVLKRIFPHTGNAFTVGVTGAPGVGKSTLVDCLAAELRKSGKSVAVLAVDPSSPYTGGALLGDRIRMNQAVAAGVYIRSMASRGSLGGLAARTPEAIFALDAAGFDYIIVETVGVGQGEVEIVRTADAVVLVLVPGLGDAVQALKAGIVEIADIFAINKADYEGADRLQKELVSVMSLAGAKEDRPEIVRTVASRGEGITELVAAIGRYRAKAEASGVRGDRRQAFLRASLSAQITQQLVAEVLEFGEREKLLGAAFERLTARSADPATVAAEIIAAYRRKPAR